MGFWDTLGEIAVNAAVAFASTQKILEWLELPLDDAEYEIKKYIRNSSQSEVELVFEGFVTLCSGANTTERTKHLLLLFRSYCIYTARRFGED